MSCGYHRGGWHGPCSQGDGIARERDSQVNEQNDFRWWWVLWKSQRTYQVVAEGYFQIKHSRKTSVAWCRLNWDPDDKEEPIYERAERETCGTAMRQPYSPSSGGWFRNRKEVSEHGYHEEGDGKGDSEAGVCHGRFCRPWKPCERCHSKYVRSHWKGLNKWWCFIKNPLSALWEKDHRGTDGGRRWLRRLASSSWGKWYHWTLLSVPLSLRIQILS